MATRKAVRAASTLVGRDDVLAELRRVVDQAVTGRGQILLLAGEAGIGKTTVLATAAGYAESRGVRVAWGWGWPGEGAPGYWPWVQVMRTLGLDIPWPGPGPGEAAASDRFQLFDEVTSLLLAESRMQPLLVLLDDLQWADQPSQLLLDFLARRLPAGAVAVLGGYRDVDPAPGPSLAAVAARSTVLPLAGLGVDEVTQLVAAVVGDGRAAGVAADVHRRTGGNPFFVQQVSWLLQAGQDGIPPGVRETLGRRFAALPAASAAVVRTAAVAGQRFSADLVARATDETPETVAGALSEAVLARVLSRDAPGGYRFAHDLFREYAYDQLPAADRARLHQRIGRQLEAERERGGNVPLAELARHFVLDNVLVEAARKAGAEIRENFAVEELVGNGRVTGIRGREKGAPAVTEQAPLVIGADGKHSLVAKAVNARSYRAKPPQSMAFYTYWAGVPAREDRPAGDGQVGEIYGRVGCAVGAWPTNNGLLITYLAWPIARFEEFRRDVEGNFLRTLDAVGLGERIRVGHRAERFRGSPDLPSYFRQPYGPGWALVGDAGLLLDPITGQGISHAFRDAELLAGAVADGLGGICPLGEALGRYHKARDRAARPMYDFTARLAALTPSRPAETALFQALARRQEDADQFFGVLAGSVPLRQFMSPRTMARLVGVRGFARLALGQARQPRSPDLAPGVMSPVS